MAKAPRSSEVIEPPAGKRRTSCRVCLRTDLKTFLSLGETPLANRFVKADQLGLPEPRFPLDVQFCPHCGQVQLGYVVSAEVLFRDYIYVSSTSETMREHFARYAAEVAERVGSANPLVVEIASNDGCLLKAFKGRPVRILGVEPAQNLAQLAARDGVPTLSDFFTSVTAEEILRRHGSAKAILANNVLAHVDDLDDFCAGIQLLLAEDGILYIEVPHLLDLIRRLEFDTIYHEHLSYFALGTLSILFARFGMAVVDVKKVGVHGGSLRVSVAKKKGRGRESRSVDPILTEEVKSGLTSWDTFIGFGQAVEQLRGDLLALLHRLKSQERAALAGYGAPAKGNTLLNYCGIGRNLLDYIVDRSSFKQGLFTPGTHIPIFVPDRLLADHPDYVLLLAWNFKDEVLRQQDVYRKSGGRFVIPLPQPTVI